MIKNETANKNTSGALTGAIIGGIIGAAAALLDIYGLYTLPWFSSALAANPVTSTIGTTVVGALIGGGIGSIFGSPAAIEDAAEFDSYQVQLREEKLDIAKNRVQKADVEVHKEVIQEEKNFTIPVTREELVVEKKVFDPENPDKVLGESEVTRIPLREERVDVDKVSVELNDVSVYKNKIEDVEHVEETLKKEKLVVETSGDPIVKEDQE